MKSHGKLSIGSFGLVIFAAFFFVASAVLAKEGPDGRKGQRMNKVTAGNPASTIININNITAWMESDGLYPPDVGGSWIGEFPRLSTVGIIYQEGIVFGGFVKDGGTPELRVGGTTYPTGMQPGKIIQNSAGVTTGAEDPNSPNVTRIWRVRPDVYPGQPANSVPELTTDAATFFQVKTSAVTQDQKDQIQQQYYTDWKEWPADKGAPWYVDTVGTVEYNDASHSYDPNNPHDIPGIPGASQTVWFVCNDLNTGLVNTLYGSPPIGIEEQQTVWAYATSTPLNNIYFKHVKLIYDGTANSNPNSEIDSMYVVQWRDPDNGDAGDDFSGSDSTLSLGYCYNGEPVDAKYAAIGLPPAASGAVFLQGPSHYTGNPTDSAVVDFVWRHGYAYWHPVALTGYDYFAAGTSINDPTLGGDYTGTQEFFNLMRGDLPDPAYPAGTPFWQSSTYASAHNIVTNYMLNGDPVTHTGWVDGYDVPMGDRRDVNVSGPFTLKLHDTVDVVVAMVGGLGTNYISSVSVLKYNTTFAHYAFNNLFKLPSPPPAPQVTAAALNDTVVLNWGGNLKSVQTIENSSEAGFKFEGYNVYQLPSPSSSISDGVRIATYDLKDGILTVLDNAVDPASGVVITKPSEFGTDSGIQRFITITQDHLRSVPLVDGQNYYFAVTAYTVNIDPNAPFHALESAPVVLTVQPHSPNPGVNMPLPTGDLSNITHNGVANASVQVNVVDPTAVTGDQYQVVFHNETYSLGSDGVWTDVTAASAAKRKTVKDLTGSYASSTASWSETPGAIDIHTIVDVVSPNYDYCDGVKLQFPAGIIIDKIEKPISNNTGDPIPYYFNKSTNTIWFGDTTILFSSDTTLRTQNGVFAGGEDIVVTAHPATLPMLINYTMYDDNWGDMNGYPGGLVDVSGVDTLSGPVANKTVVQKQWDVLDLTKKTTALKNQTILGGQDIYAPSAYFAANGLNGPGGSTGSQVADVGVGANVVFDGIQVAVNGSYSAPTTMAGLKLNGTAASNVGSAAHPEFTPGDYDIADFTAFSGFNDGTAASSLPSYGLSGGVPLTDITDLQQGYELRWTGVLGDTTINGRTVVITKSGGSIATLFGASNYSIANHPLNPNPGSTAPFAIRIPFEVWNVDKGEQVNLLVWDRNTAGLDPTTASVFPVWRENDRMYAWVVNTKYNPTVLDTKGSAVADSSTWSIVFFASKFTTGDVIDISYSKPLQIGKDTFTFTVPAPTFSESSAKKDVSKVNVFPNPYYGYQARETNSLDKRVTFNHLPTKATIRIYNLAGVLVRTIYKNDATQFAYWDLRNQGNLPVASGVYIVYVDMGQLGSKILKMALVQQEQVLPTY